MSLLDIKNLSVAFTNGDASSTVVDDVSFSIKKGEMLALVGESGSGKSVSALSVMQLLSDNAACTGNIMFDGHDMLQADEKMLHTIRGKKISMVFQEPMSALNPLHTIGAQIEEVIRLHQDLSEQEIAQRVDELISMVGLDKFRGRLDAYPHQLSGGERQRVMIAMAMANQPDLLIADEPTTALDVTLQTQILSLLKELQKSHDMAILLITHDLTIVKRLADAVAIMQKGKLVEHGETKTVFKNPQHAYTQMLLSSEPKGAALPLKKNARPIISTDNLKVHFPIKRGFFGRTVGHVKAVDGVSLSLKSGETIGIVGESGSGKTTLGLALLRLIKSEGPIVFCGRSIDEETQSQLRHQRQHMQIVFQDPFASLNPRMSIKEIIAEGLKVHRPHLMDDEHHHHVIDILDKVGLSEDMANRYPHEFSGGQRQRINITRAMILKPKLVVLDEPTSALDLSVQSQIIDLLKSFQSKNDVSYLFISHDLRVVKAISHRVMVLKSGKVIESSDAQHLFDAPQHEYTKSLISAAFDEAV